MALTEFPHSEESAQRLSRRTHGADPADRQFLPSRGDHSIRRREGDRNSAAAKACPSPGGLTVSSNRASRRLLCRPDLPRLYSRRKRLAYLTIRIQAPEQSSRRADGRQFAAPRGLHRLDGFLVQNQRLERESWPRGKAGAEPRFIY